MLFFAASTVDRSGLILSSAEARRERTQRRAAARQAREMLTRLLRHPGPKNSR